MSALASRASSGSAWLRALAAVGVAGTALELAIDRHWDGLEQLLPWGALALATGAVALAGSRSSGGRRGARLLAAAVLALSMVGIWRHVHANFETAPLDFRFADRWESMSFPSKVWEAASGGVGPAPPFVSGALALPALAALGATFLEREDRRT